MVPHIGKLDRKPIPNREYLGVTLGKVTSTIAGLTIEYPNGQILTGIKETAIGIWREQLSINL